MALSALIGSALLFFSAEAGQPSVRRLGTYDIFMVEANPIVFRGRAWLMEYIRWMRPDKRHRDNDSGDSYFRFKALDDLATLTPPFARSLHMGNAFVDGDRVVVTAVEGWGKSRFYQTESTDLVHWTEPRVILEDPEWAGYNTTVCKADGRYVMAFELAAPKKTVGVAKFTMCFAESRDLREWRVIDGAVMGREFYTGGPMLRYFDGWFYFFHLGGSYERGFITRVRRSRDLRLWELSPAYAIPYGPEDRKIHPKARFSAHELETIAKAVDINASDIDMCEYGGKLVFFYSWGDQRGHEFAALAEADCTEREFCESFFRPDASQDGVNERREFRLAVAAGGEAAKKAIEAGIVDGDPAIRRAAYWELSRIDPARTDSLLETMVEDTSPEVGTLAVDFVRTLPEGDRRNALFGFLSTKAAAPETRKAAAEYVGFPFHRENLALSENPVYDHALEPKWRYSVPTGGWRFLFDRDESAHSAATPPFAPGADISSPAWIDVSIGHHWESERAIGEYDGVGWYARDFTLPDKVKGASYELRFDGVDEDAWVWINGKYVGQRVSGPPGWKTPFRFDVSGELEWGGVNRIVVRVKDTFAGGGIWKGIELEVLR